MTERLYYTDSYLREFTARIRTGPRTGAPSTSTAPPFIPLPAANPLTPGPLPASRAGCLRRRGAHRAPPCRAARLRAVECAIDWSRRFDHMQQHTGQHLLSAVFEEWFGLHTVSFHLGAESSTIDLEGGALGAGRRSRRRAPANGIVFENRGVAVAFQHAAEAQGLRKARTAKAPCASFPSKGSTAALAAEPMCAPPGRWGHPPAQARQGAASRPRRVPVRRACATAGARGL